MSQYEYKVVPAPAKGQKARGVKTPEARFALAVQNLLNEMGADGWEYVRAEMLPSEERHGLTGSTTNWRNVLIFRRARETDIEQFHPEPLDRPAPPAPLATAPAVAAPAAVSELAPEPRLTRESGSTSEDLDPPAAWQSRRTPPNLKAIASDPEDNYETDMPEDGMHTDEGIDDEIAR